MIATMGRLIRGWTDLHALVALALTTGLIAGVVSVAHPAPYHLASAGIALLTVVAALFVDGFGGIVVGVTAAAALVAVQQIGGAWTRDNFVVSLAAVLALIALAWATGLLSAALHGRSGGRHVGGAAQPAYGSLGLLAPDMALARLDEEVARADRHHRPLAVVIMRTLVIDHSLDANARDAAERTVARLVETLLRDTDVPFSMAHDEVGAILPETTTEAAWELIGPILDAASRATFTVRGDGERRSLAEAAELHVGLAALPLHADNLVAADSLLTQARNAAKAEEDEARAGEQLSLATSGLASGTPLKGQETHPRMSGEKQ